jgi:hypothetical protein
MAYCFVLLPAFHQFLKDWNSFFPRTTTKRLTKCHVDLTNVRVGCCLTLRTRDVAAASIIRWLHTVEHRTSKAVENENRPVARKNANDAA